MADDLAAPAQQDEVADKRTPEQIAKHWQQQLDLAEKDHRTWRDAAKKVVERYQSKKDKLSRGSKRINILYSNVEHLYAAVYGKSAVPDVRRRWGMDDPIGTLGAEIIEKALVCCAESYDSDKPIELALKDYLTPGRGVIRIMYEPVLGEDPETGEEVIEDQLVYEQYVYWMDFLHMPARCWADIQREGWVSFCHKMTRADLRKNFEDADDIPMNWEPDLGEKRGEVSDTLKKSEVFEIWDVTDRRRYWIVKGHKKPLRVDDDPYGLEDFFPLAEPPQHYFTTDSFVPEPEFHVYQDQADDLDEIVGRISRLTRALKRRGVYDQSVKELSRLANAGDNVFIPVENYQALATKGGLAAAFQSEDLSLIANVLIQLYQQRDMLVQQIWEVVGIADIQRGSSNPNETLGAQKMKAQFGGQRMMKRQRYVQRWVRDLLKIKAELLAEHFEPWKLQEMTGITLDPQPPQPTGDPQQDQMAQQQFMQQKQQADQVMNLLRTDKLRSYRIDVETDSTIFEDAEQEKKSRSELIQALTGAVQGWGPMIQQAPQLGPLFFELVQFGMDAFKSSRGIDDEIEKLSTKIKQVGDQPPPPSPEQQKVQAEMQGRQMDQQAKQQEAAVKAQQEQAKLQAEMQRDERKHQLELEKLQVEIAGKERELELLAQKLEMERIAKERDFQMQSAEQMRMQAEREEERAFNRAHMVEDRDYQRGMALSDRDYERGMQMEDREYERANPKGNGSNSVTIKSGETDTALKAILDSQAGIAEALKNLGAPRKRVAVRDKNGRIAEAHDVPL
jgi:hypothetical protein